MRSDVSFLEEQGLYEETPGVPSFSSIYGCISEESGMFFDQQADGILGLSSVSNSRLSLL